MHSSDATENGATDRLFSESGSLHETIQHDRQFRAMRVAVLTGMKERTAAATRTLRRAVGRLGLSRHRSVALTGSYGRGHPGTYSDLDVVFVEEIGTQSTGDIESQLERSMHGYSVSVSVHSADVVAQQQDLWFWLTLTSLRLVNKNQGPLNCLLASGREYLGRVSLSAILAVYVQDPLHCVDRNDPGSPFSFNVKRGQGGVVEYGLARLLQMRLHAQGGPVSAEQFELIDRIEWCYLYLVLLRESFANSRKRPLNSYLELPEESRILPWFFLKPVAVEIGAGLHDLVCRYVASFDEIESS